MIVSGVGSVAVNGLYIETGTHESKPYYQAGSLYLYSLWGVQWTIGNTLGSDFASTMYYYSNSSAATPAGLTFTMTGILGTNPRPSVESSVLPVALASFTAINDQGAVTLNWITGSEVNVIGFLIDRKSASETEWQQIASYQTNSDLVCLNNQIGNAAYLFTDTIIEPDKTYHYRLSDVDMQGNVTVLQEIEVVTTDVAADEGAVIPERTALMPAYPNPFNPSTTITFSLSKNLNVNLQIFDFTGRQVVQLANGLMSAGYHHLEWNAGNMSSGIYFIRMETEKFIENKKCLLVK